MGLIGGITCRMHWLWLLGILRNSTGSLIPTEACGMPGAVIEYRKKKYNIYVREIITVFKINTHILVYMFTEHMLEVFVLCTFAIPGNIVSKYNNCGWGSGVWGGKWCGDGGGCLGVFGSNCCPIHNVVGSLVCV